MADDRLTEIAARTAAATPGPWDVYESGDMIDLAADLKETGHGYRARRGIARLEGEPLDNDPTHREWTAEEDWAQVRADAEFSAHAREDVPWLLEEVEQLRAERERYVGKEPTVAEEMQYLRSCLDAVYDACEAARRDGRVLTVEEIEQAADGNRPINTTPLALTWDRLVMHPNGSEDDRTIVACTTEHGRPAALFLDDEHREALGLQLVDPDGEGEAADA